MDIAGSSHDTIYWDWRLLEFLWIWHWGMTWRWHVWYASVNMTLGNDMTHFFRHLVFPCCPTNTTSLQGIGWHWSTFQQVGWHLVNHFQPLSHWNSKSSTWVPLVHITSALTWSPSLEISKLPFTINTRRYELISSSTHLWMAPLMTLVTYLHATWFLRNLDYLNNLEKTLSRLFWKYTFHWRTT